MNLNELATATLSNLISEYAGYPEHLAVVNDDIEALDAALAAADANINALHHRRDEHRPLTLAIALKRSQMAEHLISRGADVHLSAQYGRMPVQFAAEVGDERILSALMRANVNLTADFQYICYLAAKNTNVGVVTMLMDTGVLPFDQSNWMGEQPIDYAVRNPNELVLSTFMARGFRSTRRAFVHGAATNRNEKVLALVIAAGFDLSQCDVTNRRPIHFAAMNPNVAVIRQLIAAGVDVNVVDNAVENPLFCACSNPNEQVLEALIDAGAEWRDSTAASVCHAAARNHNAAVMRRVIEHGCNVNALDRSGSSTPLSIAARFGTATVVSLLLAAGADATVKNVCHVACQNACVGVVSVLLAAGASADGVSAAAIQHSNVDALRALVDAGLGLDLRATHLLGYAKRVDAVEFVLRHGADFRAVNALRASPACLSALFARGVDLTLAIEPAARSEAFGMLVSAGVGVSRAHSTEREDCALLAAVGQPTSAPVAPRILRWACNRIAEHQLALLRLRALQVCVALRDLPALQQCEILAHAFAPLESLVAFHRVWAIVTTIKHFRPN